MSRAKNPQMIYVRHIMLNKETALFLYAVWLVVKPCFTFKVTREKAFRMRSNNSPYIGW